MSRSTVRPIDRQRAPSRAVTRAMTRLPTINRWRKICRREARDDAQLRGQDKRDSLRLCPAVVLSLLVNMFAQAAVSARSLYNSPKYYLNTLIPTSSIDAHVR